MQKMMRMWILVLGMISFGVDAHSEGKAGNAFDSLDDVLNNCQQLNHQQWVKRYSDLEDQVIKSVEKDPSLAKVKDKAILEVVFPQDLPKSYPMKGAFLGCFDFFTQYQKATSAAIGSEALDQMESCYRDAYKVDPPKVVEQYMDCLKKVKY